jgi:hypothetical protein
MRAIARILFVVILFFSNQRLDAQPFQSLQVSANGRFFQTADGKPFFWLGETGWLLFSKLNREEAETYLEDRKQKGFNVIQVMVLHTLSAVNVYGDTALLNKDLSKPIVTPGSTASDPAQYDYWDHVDYIIKLAAKKSLYMGMVAVWGSAVQSGATAEQAKSYAHFLADRYKNEPNIIWMNGGDIKGSDHKDVWDVIGNVLNTEDNNHLITYHPRGRAQSSEWFHKDSWLDFNTFQSGHRRYDQDTSANETLHYGEDNWKYVDVDYALKPTKPTVDAEPSYEGIPQGLHDTTQPYWKAPDVRRYGYWSVFAGAAGYTYGHNAVMQMHKPTDKGSAFGAREYWYDAIHSEGASQMIHLKKLMLSKPYFERVPDQSMLVENGEKYDRIFATRGEDYAFIYTYNGSNMKVAMGKIKGDKVKACWFDPRTGKYKDIGKFANNGVQTFDPPGEKQDGNDWVLVLESK